MEKRIKHKEIDFVIQKHGTQGRILENCCDWVGIIVGEANAVIMKNPYLSSEIALFGFIDYPEDEEMAKILFDGIEEVAKEFKCTKIIGPVNYATWFSYRWMIAGWDEPAIFPEPENLPYVPRLCMQNGFVIDHTYSSFLSNHQGFVKPQFLEAHDKLMAKGFEYRRIVGLDDVRDILPELYDISIRSFSSMYLYSPIDMDSFREIYLSSFAAIEPVVHAYFDKRVMCGFFVTYKNRIPNRIWVHKTLAVRREYIRERVTQAIFHSIFKEAMEDGSEGSVAHLISDHNSKGLLYAKAYGPAIKKYALFSKEVGGCLSNER